MRMGPAEIVASLKELCEDEGPRLSTERIVEWVDFQGGYESNAELIAYAKKMKARQYARQLMYDDEESACGSSGCGAFGTVIPANATTTISPS